MSDASLVLPRAAHRFRPLVQRCVTRVCALLLCIGSSGVFAASAMADDARLDAVLERLRGVAAGVLSVRSDFTQEKRLALFDETLRSRGKLSLKKPDKLRWEYTEPSASGFSVNGAKGKRWSEFSERADSVDVARDMALRLVSEQLLAWASVDVERLGRGFALALTSETPVVLRLTPQDKRLREAIQSVEITFAADERSIATVEVREQGDDYTRIRFENPILNEPIDDALF